MIKKANMTSNNWDLNRLNEELLNWYSPEEVKNFTILIFSSASRTKIAPPSVMRFFDFIIVDGTLIKDRSGRLK